MSGQPSPYSDGMSLVVKLDLRGIDQIADIIAHLKTRHDELERALTAVQAESTRQVVEIRRLRRAAAQSPCNCLECIAERGRR